MPSLTQQSDSEPVSRPGAATRSSGTCPHRGVRVVGQVRRSPGTRMDCDKPLRVVCGECGETTYWPCDTYGCPECGEKKRRRLTQVVDMGASSHLANGLRGWFVTLTAPGRKDHLRWYQGQRPARRPSCECHRHGRSDGQWNAQEAKCWNRLRTAWARRQDVTFIGSVETQVRGMLHRHVVVFTDGHVGHEDLQALALAAGYGCVLDVQELTTAKEVARYVAKYVTKSSADRPNVPWVATVVDEATGEVRDMHTRATYRTWSSSRDWGVTMKQLRAVAAAQAQARARHLEVLAEVLAADQAVGLPADSTDPPARGPD